MQTDESDAFIHALEQHQAAIERGDQMKADALGMKAMLHAMEHADEDTSPWLQMMTRVREHEDQGDLAAAEQELLKVLEMVMGEDEPLNVWKAHDDLSALYARVGDKERALQHEWKALNAARQADSRPVLCAALWSIAWSVLESGDPHTAIGLADEAIERASADTLFRLELARALIVRARCHVALDDLSSAAADLAAAEPIVAPMAGSTFLSGYALAMASVLEVRSSIHSARGEHSEAVETFARAIDVRRSAVRKSFASGPRTLNGLARALVSYSTVLRAAGRLDEAGSADREAAQIRETLAPRPS